jgi:hypothetical protein
MKRTSTPDHEFELPFVYDTYVDQMILTYSQNGNNILEFTEKDIGKQIQILGNKITVTLSQEDTKDFSPGLVTAEIKLWTKERRSIISDPIDIYVSDVQNERIFV